MLKKYVNMNDFLTFLSMIGSRDAPFQVPRLQEFCVLIIQRLLAIFLDSQGHMPKTITSTYYICIQQIPPRFGQFPRLGVINRIQLHGKK